MFVSNRLSVTVKLLVTNILVFNFDPYRTTISIGKEVYNNFRQIILKFNIEHMNLIIIKFQ